MPPPTEALEQPAHRHGEHRAHRLGFNITEFSHVQPCLATALVVPFEQLRMTDVEAVGGKNASLGEMISQLAARRAGARRFRDHGACLPRVPAHGAWPSASRSASPRWNTDDVRALAEAGAQIRHWVEAPFPAPT